tara:strand:+ start:49 stop:492 length:444 start_codon:yes stop_codon:yes gene_type:complete
MKETKIDKRKTNGNKGHSTKSKKAFDRRKKISVSDNKSTEGFFNNMKEQVQLFYESTYKEILDKYIRHGEYYVYFHYLEGKVVYVGKGKNERLLSNNRTSEEHGTLVRLGLINEVIISNNLTEEIALLIEGSLIKELKPVYNVVKTN